MTYDDLSLAIKRKIICFGAGQNAKTLLRTRVAAAFAEQIAYFVDNDIEKQGSAITGMGRSYFVFPPEKLHEESDIVVLITTFNTNAINAIKRQIHEIAGKSAKCFSWPEIFLGRKCVEKFEHKSGNATRFILLNTPTYDNLGDHAIAMAERAFLQTRYRNDVVELCDDLCRHCMRDMSRHIANNDILMITGGGNMGSLYGGHDNAIHRIIENFPNNDIIIFPQSIYYEDSETGVKILEKAKALCNAHSKLVLCARDSDSYQRLARYFPSCKRLLIPDMVLSVAWPTVSMRSGIGICLRSDKEQNLAQNLAEKIIHAARGMGVDVSGIAQHKEGVVAQNTENAVLEKLSEYSSFRCIITDRLHGIVFSTITGTPCIAIDNSYGKNRALHETWLKDIPYVHFSNDPATENWRDVIAEKLESGVFGYESSAMHSKYASLVSYISSLKGVEINAR